MELLIRNFFSALSTIFLALSMIFFAMRLTPGDPVERILGPKASQEEILNYRHQLGLDAPLVKQYLIFLKGVCTGDLGDSLFKKKKVGDLLLLFMAPSIILALVSVSLSSILGFFMGIVSARLKGGPFDRGFKIVALIGLAFPIFSLAPLLVLLFSIKFNLLPVSEWTSVKHAVLPVMTLVIPLSAIIMRVTRARFLDDEQNQWVTVLQAKGLGPVAVWGRVAKVTLPTVLNVVAIQLSVVMAGTMITETIFDIPGMGQLLFEDYKIEIIP